MELLTLGVAMFGVFVAIATRPAYGLVAYFGILLLFPDYLRLSLGSLDISAARIVVLTVLTRAIAIPELIRRYRWHSLDTAVVVNAVVCTVALSFTAPVGWWVENRAGFLMDSAFAYFAFRLIIVDRASLVVLIKATAVTTVFLALHGVVETFSGWSLYQGLGQYCPWAPTKGMIYQERFGLNRAMGPCGETILFGISFAAVLPLIHLLRQEREPWRRWSTAFTACAVAGCLSTVSSGPYLALITTLVCMGFARARSLVKPGLVLIVAGCLLIELVANRHFYHVLGDFTMDPDSAWYRARLIDVAVERLPEYWAFGYGLLDPGWGWEINGLRKTDIVNDYILQAVLYGLAGLISYLAVQLLALRLIVQTYRRSRSAWIRRWAWSGGASLIGIIAVSWSVSLFGQMTTIYYCLLGIIGALPGVAATRRAPDGTDTVRQKPAPRRRIRERSHPGLGCDYRRNA